MQRGSPAPHVRWRRQGLRLPPNTPPPPMGGHPLPEPNSPPPPPTPFIPALSLSRPFAQSIYPTKATIEWKMHTKFQSAKIRFCKTCRIGTDLLWLAGPQQRPLGDRCLPCLEQPLLAMAQHSRGEGAHPPITSNLIFAECPLSHPPPPIAKPLTRIPIR